MAIFSKEVTTRVRFKEIEFTSALVGRCILPIQDKRLRHFPKRLALPKMINNTKSNDLLLLWLAFD